MSKICKNDKNQYILSIIVDLSVENINRMLDDGKIDDFRSEDCIIENLVSEDNKCYSVT